MKFGFLSRFLALVLAVLMMMPFPARCWGFYAHKKINRLAVFTLPEPMFGFYKKNIDFITEHAVDPDKRRYAIKEEAPRHYFDADHYGDHPFDSVPREWDDAVKKYGEDSILAHGIVPWHIRVMMGKLTWAFRENREGLILKYSADLGHYVADAHVPLHATSNYNGQLTNQHGIHGFWESRLPELFDMDYDFFVGTCRYIMNIRDEAWNVVRESFLAHDSVLAFEAALTRQYPADLKYGFETRGAVTMKVYSREFSGEYHELLDGQVERRMREAILMIGSCWYTAWIDAGSPDLENLKPYEPTEEERQEQEMVDRMWRTGKPIVPVKGHEE